MAAVFGFSNFIFGPPANALVTDLVPEEKRITAYAMLRLAINAGFAAGPMVAGILFVYSPFWVFAGDALTTLMFAGLALFSLPHGLRTIKEKIASPKVILKSWIDSAKDVSTNPRYKQFLIACSLMGIAFMQVFNLLALTTTRFGISPSAYGIIMGFNGVLIILIEVPLTHWLKRFSSTSVLAIGYRLIGLGCIVFGLSSGIVSFFLGMAVFTLGEIIAPTHRHGLQQQSSSRINERPIFRLPRHDLGLRRFDRQCRRLALRPAWVNLVVLLRNNRSARRVCFAKDPDYPIFRLAFSVHS